MIRRTVVAALLLVCGVAAGMVLTGRMRENADAVAQTPTAPAVSAPAGVAGATALVDFSRIAERTVPAVVNVSAQQVVRRRVPNDPFSLFFGDADDIFGARRGVQNSLGSGVIVSGDGYILTN